MRYLFVFLSSFFFANINAQQSFTGVIEYEILAPSSSNPNGDSISTLTAYFGPDGIRLTFKEGVKSDNQEILVLLDSAKVYELNIAEKKYSVRDLFRTPPIKTKPQSKVILGYKTTGFQLSPPNVQTQMLIGGWKQISINAADDLYYPIPDSLAFNLEFILIHNNKIILGGEGAIHQMSRGDHNHDIVETVKVEAVSIIPKKLDPSLFKVPADFEIETENWSSILDTSPYFVDTVYNDWDTTITEVDTFALIKPIEKKSTKETPNPKKKKTIQQQSEARKPEQ